MKKQRIVGDGRCCFTALNTALNTGLNVDELSRKLWGSNYLKFFSSDLADELALNSNVWGSIDTVCRTALEFSTEICVHMGEQQICAYMQLVQENAPVVHLHFNGTHYDVIMCTVKIRICEEDRRV